MAGHRPASLRNKSILKPDPKSDDPKSDPPKKHGRNTGRVAVARAMLKTIYAMLKHQETFRPMGQGITGQRPGVMAS